MYVRACGVFFCTLNLTSYGRNRPLAGLSRHGLATRALCAGDRLDHRRREIEKFGARTIAAPSTFSSN